MTGRRYDVTRTNGREVEIVRDLDEQAARRLVHRDLDRGDHAYATPVEARRNGRIPR